MKRIKITEQQADMLKNMGKTKVLKVTQEQYNRIIEAEELLELDRSDRVGREWGKNLSGQALKQHDNTKIPGITEMYEAFINELYGITESDPVWGESNFKKLSKLMEGCGLIKNNKIAKEKFNGDKNMVREIISLGLEEMCNGGSAYSAMEIMEEAINMSKDSSSDELFKNLVDKFLKTNDNPYVKNEYMKGNYKEAWLASRKLTKEQKLAETEGQPKGIVGLDILNHEPFASLPQSRDINNMRNDVKIPSIQDGDVMNTMMEKDSVEKWISEFKRRFKEEPIFELNPEGVWYDKIRVINKVFKDWQNQYIQGKAAALSSFGSKDEATDATSSGQSTGSMGKAPISKLHTGAKSVSDELINDEIADIETDVETMSPETEEQCKRVVAELLAIMNEPGINNPIKLVEKTREIRRILHKLDGDAYSDMSQTFSYKVPNMFNNLLKYAEDSLENGISQEYMDQFTNVYESLMNLTQDIHLEEEEEITEETTAGSVGGQYATPGFASSEFMGTKGKKGKAPVNKGITHKKPTLPGGEFVKIKDKCKKYPYCNQGTDAIAEAIAKETGRDISEVKKIITNFNKK